MTEVGIYAGLLVVAVGIMAAGFTIGYRRGYLAGVSDCKKKLPEIASIAVDDVVKNWSVH